MERTLKNFKLGLIWSILIFLNFIVRAQSCPQRGDFIKSSDTIYLFEDLAEIKINELRLDVKRDMLELFCAIYNNEIDPVYESKIFNNSEGHTYSQKSQQAVRIRSSRDYDKLSKVEKEEIERLLVFNDVHTKQGLDKIDSSSISSLRKFSIKALSFLNQHYVIEITFLLSILVLIISSKIIPLAIINALVLLVFILRFTSTSFFPIFTIFDTVWVSILITSHCCLFFRFRQSVKSISTACEILLALLLGLLVFFPKVFIYHPQTPMPVLRTNFWLMTHVLCMIVSYSILAITWVSATINLYTKQQRIALSKIQTMIKFGISFLALGIFLGAIWADKAWGRFWAWDPKETWSLITLCLYSILFHIGKIKKVKESFMALSISLSFTGVMITWFGVNFVFSSGLHSYGFSNQGAVIFFILIIIQFISILRYVKSEKA
ncbi:cytochrome c biogenesis protein [Halobacteriovorax sp.]|uniref:cytochrome c biogenesis protein n=1 Tax=Halobacteriovorax sp. TaxID=2020862 RepID=UPI003AF2FED3